MKRRSLVSLAAGGVVASRVPAQAAATPGPVNATGDFALVADYCFGNARPDATIHNMAELRKLFRFKYIYDGGQLDSLPTYWSRHRDYPEGDPRSLHVFKDSSLVLKRRIPKDGGIRDGGLESGMLRALLPVTPGMYLEMRTKLPRGLGVWPAFWLNPGVETPDGQFSALPWPPEIDIFEFYVWQGRTRPRILEGAVHPAKDTGDLGPVRDIFSLMPNGRYDPGIDFSEDFHVFALDWVKDRPIWVVDGKPIKQTVIGWQAPPAHILVTNQIGMNLKSVDLHGMGFVDGDWDYTIDYLRVWKRV
jgi:hypothetical protein